MTGGLLGAVTQTVVYGHRDFEYMLPSKIRASFIWAPYADNLTDMFANWCEAWDHPYFLPGSLPASSTIHALGWYCRGAHFVRDCSALLHATDDDGASSS